MPLHGNTSVHLKVKISNGNFMQHDLPYMPFIGVGTKLNLLFDIGTPICLTVIDCEYYAPNYSQRQDDSVGIRFPRVDLYAELNPAEELKYLPIMHQDPNWYEIVGHTPSIKRVVVRTS